MIIEFYKYQGTGNDFIIIDDREKEFDITDNNLIAALCERRMGIGADGFILLREHDTLDFEMIYFNADGKQSSMCGNGGRCIIAFAQMLEMIEDETTFMAIDGEHKGRLMDDGIYLQMQDVKKIEGVGDGLVLNTGSPHYIEMVDDLDNLDVNKEGRKIRMSFLLKQSDVFRHFMPDDFTTLTSPIKKKIQRNNKKSPSRRLQEQIGVGEVDEDEDLEDVACEQTEVVTR